MNRRLIGALTALVLVVAGLGAALVVQSKSNDSNSAASTSPTASPTATPAITPANLLVTLVNTDKKTKVVTVQGVTSDKLPMSETTVTPGLTVDINDKGLPSSLSNYGSTDVGSASYQVGNQMGIAIQGGWGLERVAFAALVDAVGGLTMGKAKRQFSGQRTAAYVLDAKPVDGKSRVQARFAVVWQRVLAKLPADQGHLMDILTSLGATSQRTLPVDKLAQLLTSIKRVSAANGVDRKALATEIVGKGTPFRSRIMDVDRAVPVTLKMYPETQLVPGVAPSEGADPAKPRVRVLFAGDTGAEALAAKHSVFEAELTWVWGGPLPSDMKAPKSARIYVSSKPNVELVGEPLATAFEVKPATVAVDRERTLGVQALVVAP